MSQLTIFTDGGSRGNPGPAALGVFVQDETGQTRFELGAYLGVMTNNEAEYEAFLASIAWVEQYAASPTLPDPIAKITWKLDSKLVVEQLNKRWKIKEDRMRQKAEKCWVGLHKLTLPYSIIHVPREQNAEADRLVNQALDANQA